MSRQEITGIEGFACFDISVYIRLWYEAPRAAAAPANDLSWPKQLSSYHDKTIAEAAARAFARHLWYLSESLVSLSFFDSDVSLSIKREMVKALDKPASTEKAGKLLRRIEIDTTASSFKEATVADFVTSRSRHFFEALSLPSTFLQSDPSEWEKSVDFRKSLEYVNSMKVVNDFSERSMSLMQTYNNILTKKRGAEAILVAGCRAASTAISDYEIITDTSNI